MLFKKIRNNRLWHLKEKIQEITVGHTIKNGKVTHLDRTKLSNTNNSSLCWKLVDDTRTFRGYQAQQR